MFDLRFFDSFRNRYISVFVSLTIDFYHSVETHTETNDLFDGIKEINMKKAQ